MKKVDAVRDVVLDQHAPGVTFDQYGCGTDLTGPIEVEDLGGVFSPASGLKTHPESLASSPIGPDEIHLPVSNPQRLGDEKRKIRWDPDREQIVGDDEGAAMLSRPNREPWIL